MIINILKKISDFILKYLFRDFNLFTNIINITHKKQMQDKLIALRIFYFQAAWKSGARPQIPEKCHNHHQHAKHHHSRVSVNKTSLCFANLCGNCTHQFCRTVHDAILNSCSVVYVLTHNLSWHNFTSAWLYNYTASALNLFPWIISL